MIHPEGRGGKGCGRGRTRRVYAALSSVQKNHHALATRREKGGEKNLLKIPPEGDPCLREIRTKRCKGTLFCVRERREKEGAGMAPKRITAELRGRERGGGIAALKQVKGRKGAHGLINLLSQTKKEKEKTKKRTNKTRLLFHGKRDGGHF